MANKHGSNDGAVSDERPEGISLCCVDKQCHLHTYCTDGRWLFRIVTVLSISAYVCRSHTHHNLSVRCVRAALNARRSSHLLSRWWHGLGGFSSSLPQELELTWWKLQAKGRLHFPPAREQLVGFLWHIQCFWWNDLFSSQCLRSLPKFKVKVIISMGFPAVLKTNTHWPLWYIVSDSSSTLIHDVLGCWR